MTSLLPMPFDLPARDALVNYGSTKKSVRLHYMGGVFPVSVDDKNAETDPTEYIRRKWMPPGGMEGTVDYGVCGGLIRERKRTRPHRGAGFEVADMMDEVRLIIAAGFDGIWWDVLQVPQHAGDDPQRWKQLHHFLEAVDKVAAADHVNLDGFVALMIDGSTSASKNADTLASALKSLVGRKVWKVDGKLIVGSFGPELAPAYANKTSPASETCVALWAGLSSKLKAAGVQPEFWFCFTRTWFDYAGKLAALANGGLGSWGSRDPKSSSGENNSNLLASMFAWTKFDKRWMAAVSVGDERPREGRFWERRGSEQLRASWLSATGLDTALAKVRRAAHMIQVPTWDDLAEGAHVYPTEHNGGVWLVLMAYYLVRYKTGAWPAVKKDAIMLLHRVQPVAGVSYSSRQTKFMVKNGATPVADIVEALIWSPVPTGTVVLTVGNVVTTTKLSDLTPVAPGLYSIQVPLRLGRISARLSHRGVLAAFVTSPFEVSNKQVVQDMAYRGVSSLR